MRGIFYAPLLGIAMLLMAVMFFSTNANIEKQNREVITGKLMASLYFTYAEIAPWDVRSLLEAYIRQRVYEDINVAFAGQVEDYIISQFPKWLQEFVNEYESKYAKLGISNLGGVSARRLEENYIEINVESGEIKVEVKTEDGRIELSVPIPRRFLIPFPITLVEDMEKEIVKIVEELNNIKEKIKAGDFSVLDEESVPTVDNILKLLGKGNGHQKSQLNISYDKVSGCILRGFHTLENKWFIKTIYSIFAKTSDKWHIPGLDRSARVSTRKEVKIRFFEHKPVVIYWKGKAYVADLIGNVSCAASADMETFIEKYLCKDCRCKDEKDDLGNKIGCKCSCNAKYEKLEGFCNEYAHNLERKKCQNQNKTNYQSYHD